MGLEAFESANLVVQLAEGLAADVTAGQNRENLKQRGNCGTSRPVVVPVAVVEHRVVEELKPEECPHTLRQGLLIVCYARCGLSSDFSSGFGHLAILRHPVAGGK
jgi:hypothetical protein